MSAGWRANRRPVGASTITQQVAKNMLLSSEISIERKVKEILLATRIEAALPKDRILELYLNEIYLGRGAYGVAAAAQTYFDKSLDELTLGEAAFLAGLAQGAQPIQSGALSAGGEGAARLGPRSNGRGRRGGRSGGRGQAEAQPLTSAPPGGGGAGQGALFRRGGAGASCSPAMARRSLYGAGLSVRTSLDARLQAACGQGAARRADRL